MAIEELIDVVAYSVEGLAGWRYLFSPAYRRRVHARWRTRTRLEAVGEAGAMVLGFIMVTAILAVLGWWLYSRLA